MLENCLQIPFPDPMMAADATTEALSTTLMGAHGDPWHVADFERAHESVVR